MAVELLPFDKILICNHGYAKVSFMVKVETILSKIVMYSSTWNLLMFIEEYAIIVYHCP